MTQVKFNEEENVSLPLKTLMVVLALGATAAACGRNAGLQTNSAQPAASSVALHVNNDYALAMDVYTYAGGVSNRLGTVSPGMSTTFTLPPYLLRNGLIQVYAYPIGGGPEVASPPLTLQAGETVDFHIALNLINTMTMVK
jgi:hypothetical protein